LPTLDGNEEEWLAPDQNPLGVGKIIEGARNIFKNPNSVQSLVMLCAVLLNCVVLVIQNPSNSETLVRISTYTWCFGRECPKISLLP
jgi:hypothetical protein